MLTSHGAALLQSDVLLLTVRMLTVFIHLLFIVLFVPSVSGRWTWPVTVQAKALEDTAALPLECEVSSSSQQLLQM